MKTVARWKKRLSMVLTRHLLPSFSRTSNLNRAPIHGSGGEGKGGGGSPVFVVGLLNWKGSKTFPVGRPGRNRPRDGPRQMSSPASKAPAGGTAAGAGAN